MRDMFVCYGLMRLLLLLIYNIAYSFEKRKKNIKEEKHQMTKAMVLFFIERRTQIKI